MHQERVQQAEKVLVWCGRWRASDTTVWAETSDAGSCSDDAYCSGTDSPDEAGATGNREFTPEIMMFAYEIVNLTDRQRMTVVHTAEATDTHSVVMKRMGRHFKEWRYSQERGDGSTMPNTGMRAPADRSLSALITFRENSLFEAVYAWQTRGRDLNIDDSMASNVARCMWLAQESWRQYNC